MSDGNRFCQPKFMLKGVGYFLMVVFSFSLFACSSDDGSYNSNGETGYVPTRFVPYRQSAYRSQYPVYRTPHSRSYQNPYDFQYPNPYYPSYYDQDNYYVPPSHYRNVEPDYEYGADQKS